MKRYLLISIFIAAILFVTTQKQADGPLSVNLGDVYKRGATKIEDADLAKLPSLPRGYVALNNKAYQITTDAEAVGPYTVSFRASSVADEDTFKNLRIFHAEPEQFDPDNLVWIDRTSAQPNAADPDFATKTINAYSSELYSGFYVIGKMVEKIAPNTAVADLEIVAKGTPEFVQAPNDITLSVTVKNNGPDIATNVGLAGRLTKGLLASMAPSQGTCKSNRNNPFCKLGRLAVGEMVTIKIVIKSSSDYPGPYEAYFSTAAGEKDSNIDNNEGMGEVFAHPDPNQAAEVTLEGLLDETILDPGSTLTLKATATDPDGSITKVEFWQDFEALGIGSTGDAKNFSFMTGPLKNGKHVFSAVATDNGGRESESRPRWYFVNGPAKVRIVEPKANAVLKPGGDVTIAVEALSPSGIKSVEILINGVECGPATPAGNNRFVLKQKNVVGTTYRIEAFVIDNAGLVSKNREFQFKVSEK